MLLLSALIAIAPFSIDVYMPAFGDMASFYKTDYHSIELSVAAFFFGSACGQLVLAPFSDRIGRRPVLFFGLSIFLIATVLIIVSQTVEQLLIFRFFQAVGCGSISVTAPSVVRDCFNEQDTAKMFSLIATVMMAAPFMAPLLGAVLLHYFAWQSIFWFLLIYASLIIVLMYYKLPETRPKTEDVKLSRIVTQSFGRYKKVFQNKEAVSYLACIVLCSVWFVLFLTDASFIYMEYFKASKFLFALLFGGAVVVVIFANFLNIYLLRTRTARQILLAAVRVELFLIAVTFIYANFFTAELWGIFILFACTQGCLHVITANGFASFLAYYSENTGTASAIFGSSRFGFGGLCAYLLATFHDGSLLPFTGISLVAVFLAFILSFKLNLNLVDE